MGDFQKFIQDISTLIYNIYAYNQLQTVWIVRSDVFKNTKKTLDPDRMEIHDDVKKTRKRSNNDKEKSFLVILKSS